MARNKPAPSNAGVLAAGVQKWAARVDVQAQLRALKGFQ
jgi:hypothetical protein